MEVNAMALVSRLTRLFQSDFHAVLDRIEEPDALLRQAVRDMEDALARDEQRVKNLHADRAQMRGSSETIFPLWADIWCMRALGDGAVALF